MLVRKQGHVYLEWDDQMFYTTPELRRMHRHFYHPHPDRIYNLLKKAEDPKATSKTLRQLEDLTSSCEVCQFLAKEPGRMRVSLPPESIIFNRVVLMDLMNLEGKRLIYIVHKDTLFNVAVFLHDGESTKNVWDAYVRYWVNAYVGYLEELHDDQGPLFQSIEWRNLLQQEKLTTSTFDRRTERCESNIPHFLQTKSSLSFSVHAMNCVAGLIGLAPSLLVFGIVPRMPITPVDLPEQGGG